MNKSNQLVVFLLNEQRYALYLTVVERVISAVEITLLPKAPDIILGVINFQGKVIPVINIRRRFGITEREIELTDQFIIADTSKRTVALVVDDVSGVIEPVSDIVIDSENITAGVKYVDGVVKLNDGMILIHDIDRFLSLEEENNLDSALGKKKAQRNIK
jgi:purine-binding chemotaxis protein CheW